MPSLIKGFALLLSTLSCSFLLASSVGATSLNWENTYPHQGRGRFIKFSSAAENTVYAGIDHNGAFDILKSSDRGQTWTSIKGDLLSGSEINWISDSESNQNIILISIWASGIYLTENGGQNWINIFPAPTSLVVQPHPTDLNTIYVGIGGNNTGISGLYKTDNKGASWIKIPNFGTSNIGQIHFDPTDNSRIYVVSDPKYYRSDDSGQSWIQLALDNFFTKGTVIDKNNSSTIYSARFDTNEGVYKSFNRGEAWEWKQTGPTGKIFQIIDDSDGTIFATRIASNPNGGVWRSHDGAETWENVQDPVWGETQTWGIDAKDGVVVVSVEGQGLFVASNSGIPTPTPTPVPGPNPVVVIPGFGGSFSTKKFILQQETSDYHDWTMMPVKAPGIYNPFLSALQRAFYLQNNKVFFFPYDFTKSVTETGSWLNDFIQNEILANNPDGTKVDIVGHSMGGLVARYCFEKVPGCADKIDQVVTAGTPHKGAVDDYYLWEGADFKDLDPLTKYAAKFLLRLYGLPKWDRLAIIQSEIVGARDFMPVFEYINNKNYSDLTIGKNSLLETELNPISEAFKDKTFTLSGNKLNSTSRMLTVSNPNKKETARGYWLDGKPKLISKDVGDGTVLQESSQIEDATRVESYNGDHVSYLNTEGSVSDILQYLGLSTVSLAQSATSDSATVFYSNSPFLEIKSVSPKSGSVSKPSQNVLFMVNDSKPGKRQVTVSSKVGGSYIVNGWYADNNSEKVSKPVKVKLLPGEMRTISLLFD